MTNLSKCRLIPLSLIHICSAVVAAFSVAAIKQFGQQCIESAAEVNAANSPFEQTFGSMESQAKRAIQSVAKESGILKTRLQGVGTDVYKRQRLRSTAQRTPKNSASSSRALTARLKK